jgi:hypothetical protein
MLDGFHFLGGKALKRNNPVGSLNFSGVPVTFGGGVARSTALCQKGEFWEEKFPLWVGQKM